jgi:DNA polymerase elongation subunit (family B)
MLLQPADWLEVQGSDKKYAVDIFGRLEDDRVAKLRITGFQPYFYVRSKDDESRDMFYTKISSAMSKEGKYLGGLHLTQEWKLDAMAGFSSLKPIKVWKLTFNSGLTMKSVSKVLGDAFDTTDIFESGLPPLIRLFHETDISPASPISFEAEEEEPGEDENVDVCFTVNYKEVKSDVTAKIGLYAAAYDIETYSSTGNFPQASIPEDEIIQIGISFRYTDDLLNSFKRIVFVSGTCAPSEDESVTFVSCKSEKHLLQEFQRCIKIENPDILAGYNTFGFDDSYIADRCEYNKLDFNIGRVDVSSWKMDRAFAPTEKKTFELASGKFAVRYLEVAGRLGIDLLLSVRREQSLDSYKLDNVANTFLRDKVTNIVILTGAKTQLYEIHTKTTRGLFKGNLVRFDIMTNTTNPYRDGQKFYVSEVKPKSFIINSGNDVLFQDLTTEDTKKMEWCFGKDDISAQDMFASHRGKAEDRAMIAKYCIQDCDLVLTLMAKLDTFVNARGMADVCRVPIQYIFLRGQGIKIFSAVVYNASKRNQILANQEKIGGSMSYEGAIVLPPKIGMYLDQPISVLDFNSLYPSNMIAFNLSPDTLVYVKTFSATGKKLKHEGPDGEDIKKAGFVIDEISYDTFDDEKKPSGRITCGFVQPSADPRSVGVLPLTLDILLKKRKETRKILETTEDESQKAVLNGLQLAYKLVANSVYGQCGSSTSAIRKLEVAACTTAAGRERLLFAKKIVETEFGAEVVYGDTDSAFIRFPTTDLSESIILARKTAERITSLCRKPYKIEYEKTFYPFILFCRKRYVGLMYEDDVKKCKRKTMGIALKRRDNAPIVKDVFGGALDILLEHRNIQKSFEFVKEMLIKVMKNEIPLEKYIITKQLRDDYITTLTPEWLKELQCRVDEYVAEEQAKHPTKTNIKIEHAEYISEAKLTKKLAFNRLNTLVEFYGVSRLSTSIAHRTLADRMEERDAGNKPQVGDRLSFIYVEKLKDAKKQGDRIENLDYVKEKKLKPDTEFYISNQIQNPVAQMFALAIEELEGYKPATDYKKAYEEFRETLDEEEATLKVLALKEKQLDKMLFLGASYLNKHKRGPMDVFIKRA